MNKQFVIYIQIIGEIFQLRIARRFYFIFNCMWLLNLLPFLLFLLLSIVYIYTCFCLLCYFYLSPFKFIIYIYFYTFLFIYIYFSIFPLFLSFSRFHLHYTLDKSTEGWKYSTGFINKEMCAAHLPPPSADSMYVYISVCACICIYVCVLTVFYMCMLYVCEQAEPAFETNRLTCLVIFCYLFCIFCWVLF